MEKYNLDHLILIESFKSDHDSGYIIRPERKLLGFVIQKAGIYDTAWNCRHTDNFLGEKIPNHCYLSESHIWIKPRVSLTYKDGYHKTYYFDTFEEAEKYSDSITSNGRFIE